MAQNASSTAQAARNINNMLANLSQAELIEATQAVASRVLPHGAVQHAGQEAVAPRADAREDLMASDDSKSASALGAAAAALPVGRGSGSDEYCVVAVDAAPRATRRE